MPVKDLWGDTSLVLPSYSLECMESEDSTTMRTAECSIQQKRQFTACFLEDKKNTLQSFGIRKTYYNNNNDRNNKAIHAAAYSVKG